MDVVRQTQLCAMLLREQQEFCNSLLLSYTGVPLVLRFSGQPGMQFSAKRAATVNAMILLLS